MKYKLGDLLKVEWEDHWGRSGWTALSELSLEPITINSIGYVIKEDDNILILSSCVDENKNYSTIQTIIKKCITKLTKVKER